MKWRETERDREHLWRLRHQGIIKEATNWIVLECVRRREDAMLICKIRGCPHVRVLAHKTWRAARTKILPVSRDAHLDFILLLTYSICSAVPTLLHRNRHTFDSRILHSLSSCPLPFPLYHHISYARYFLSSFIPHGRASTGHLL